MKTISVGELRQNPTAALNAAADGETLVVTKHNRAVADLGPHRSATGISGAQAMQRLRKVHSDESWLAELRDARDAPERNLWDD